MEKQPRILRFNLAQKTPKFALDDSLVLEDPLPAEPSSGAQAPRLTRLG